MPDCHICHRCCQPGKPANIIKRSHCSQLRLKDALFKFICSAYPASIAALRYTSTPGPSHGPAAAAAAAAAGGIKPAGQLITLPLLMSAYKDGQLVGE
jgi:hypothetical protein